MKGKLIFITGATSGIGEGCARKFAAMGSNLILNGRNTAKLEALKQELTAQGVEVLILPFDVRDREAMRQAVDSLEGKWRNIDVLINNAGLVIGMDKEHEGSLDEWDIVIDTKHGGTWLRTYHQYRFYRRRCCLCRWKCLLCYQGSREGFVRWLAY